MSIDANHSPIRRRGALLLLVLTALTFFMMIGTLMLVIATRTRTTSRAFADATTATTATSLMSQTMLDDALMLVLRGRRALEEAALPEPLRGQSLLEDKYGTDVVEGIATAPARLPAGPLANSAAILMTTVRDLVPPPEHPCDLNGRLITFKQGTGVAGDVTYRIVRTTGASQPLTLYLASVPNARTVALPTGDSEVVINGREFFQTAPTDNNEAHDAYGPSDPWLAGTPLRQSRPITDGAIFTSYGGRSDLSSLGQDADGDDQADGCDNDNDGVADSWWIKGIVPDRPSPEGGVFKHEFAFLIRDLDGRMNLNAAGSLTPVVTSSNDWPATFLTANMAAVPIGMGYGPADVAAGRVVATGTAPQGAPGFPGRWPQICQTGTTPTPVQAVPSPTQRRPTPSIGAPVEGRYGPAGPNGRWTPGRSGGTLDTLSLCSIVGGSPSDLHARYKVFLGPAPSGVPPLLFFTPDGTMPDLIDSPYQARLDADGPRILRTRQGMQKSGTTASAVAPNHATDSPFGVAELERVLRQFDPDASTLPPRLASLLADITERSRMTVTTDSWDTPAMTGEAMKRILNHMRAFPAPTASGTAAAVYASVSPDVSAGLRFDLNRPLDHPTAFNGIPAAQAATARRKLKERYCRHLFSLLDALGMPRDKDTAQWVANVCDFRDPDSTMTRFRFDPGQPPVFGAERPEIVITETVAWHDGATGGLTVVLYHPWDARVVDNRTATDPSRFAPTELIDPSLAAPSEPNSLDLTRRQGDNPIWRLRVDGGPTVDFSTLSTGSEAARLRLKPNSYVCVQSSGGNTTLPTITMPSFEPKGPGRGTVVLERLADPTRNLNDDEKSDDFNPYIAVDEADLLVAEDADSAVKRQRDGATFWRQSWANASGPPAPYPAEAPWYHWPNRPFVGIAELALVPSGDANTMLQTRGPATSPALDKTDAARRLILDAVHVPSRFAGSSRPIGSNQLLTDVIRLEEVCTTSLPQWREPGKVNVNTVALNTGHAEPQFDNSVWLALVGPAAAATNGISPFLQGGDQAADSLRKMLTLSEKLLEDPSGPPLVVEEPPAPRDKNPAFRLATAIRLGNVGTIRSNVFAIWITLKITDTSASAPSPTYKRMFAIVDRSIPVGFNKGENLNVRDVIRLQRFID